MTQNSLPFGSARMCHVLPFSESGGDVGDSGRASELRRRVLVRRPWSGRVAGPQWGVLGDGCLSRAAAGQVLDCAEEVVEGPVGAGGVAGGVKVHEQTTDDGENERREIRPTMLRSRPPAAPA